MAHSKITRTQIMGLVAAFLVVSPAPVIAQQEGAADVAPSITVELNSMTRRDSTCQLTFFLTNTFEHDITGLVLETVLLTKGGAVDRLTLFDMRDVPTARPRVRQFDVPDLDCDTLGQVLINGVSTCEGGDLTPIVCSNAMSLSSRIDVEVLG
jgi:hypothetical protein